MSFVSYSLMDKEWLVKLPGQSFAAHSLNPHGPVCKTSDHDPLHTWYVCKVDQSPDRLPCFISLCADIQRRWDAPARSSEVFEERGRYKWEFKTVPGDIRWECGEKINDEAWKYVIRSFICKQPTCMSHRVVAIFAEDRSLPLHVESPRYASEHGTPFP